MHTRTLLCLSLLIGGLGCNPNTSAPRTVLPGITDPTERRDLGERGPRVPPRVTIVSPRDGARLVHRQLEVLVDATGDGPLRVDVNGVPAVPDAATGRYLARIVVEEGNAVPITARVEDPAGQVARHGIVIAVDATPPQVDARSQVVVSGRVDAHDTRVTVNGTTVPVRRDLTWETKVELPPDRIVTIVAVDGFGNSTTRTLNYAKEGNQP